MGLIGLGFILFGSLFFSHEQGFNMISSIFDRLGGQKAIMNYLEKKHPHLQDRA